ncbi:MAG TPA: MFS transporter [Polyangia bacterium]|nr:MFS transporter [Polyangia bacterium]
MRAPSFRAAVGVIAAGLFVTGLGWPGLLARLPLGLYLKNQLHLPAAQVATFWAAATLGWYIKPLVGLLCDAYPLFGTRRRGYLLAGGAAAALGWLALAVVPARYGPLLGAMVALNLAIVVVSTATGGLLVEAAQAHGATGRLSALREGLIGAMSLVAGPLGGWLAARALGWTAGAGALLWLAFLPVVALLQHEAPRARDGERSRRVLASAVVQLRAIRRSPALVRAALLLFLAYLAPGFQTPLLYHQQDALHFAPAFMGQLQLVGATGALLGALIYAWLCRRLPLRTSLVGGIVLNTGSTLFYLGYGSAAAAVAITFSAAVLGSIAFLPIYDLAARATPAGSESFGYALLASVQSLATFAVSDPLGSWLYDRLQLGLAPLVWINAASTAAVLLFVPFLPRALLAPREGMAPEH